MESACLVNRAKVCVCEEMMMMILRLQMAFFRLYFADHVSSVGSWRLEGADLSCGGVLVNVVASIFGAFLAQWSMRCKAAQDLEQGVSC